MAEMHTDNFQASDALLIDQSGVVDASDLSLLFNLYLPFLGPKGFALYQFFLEEKRAAGMEKAEEPDHYLLLDSLSLSAPDFVRARRALEGVGLLKHYEGSVHGKQAVRYLLLKPLTATAFFKEDLLSGLLFHYVGEARYLALAKRYEQAAIGKLQGEHEATASFLSVFELPDASLKPKVDVAKVSGADVAGAERAGSASGAPIDSGLDEVVFDFEGMAELVHGTTKDKVEKARELILTEQVLYGINEAQMATAVTRSINLDDHELNKAAFLSYLERTWSDNRQQEQLVDQGKRQAATENAADGKSAAGSTDSEKTTPAQSKKTGNAALDALYQAANNLSPVDFIGQIKEQNHGYVTNSERNLLAHLVERRILPVPALNMLSYQVLVNMDQSDLKRNLVDAIANSWAKAGVKSAEDAVAAIKAHKQKSQAGQNGPSAGSARGSWQRGGNKQEPSFTSNEAAAKQNVDQDAVKKALDLMKNYKTKD
ncbi:DnaD domain protein [Fructobacillus sp. M1-13]|uniref:Uncharacterized protein n=1 Tax=Fructobacillus papyriferae TaxID=2713171 RepID=A0ABS5QPE7_9LACO|nr:DnaD domain protein [Fructobacillus papyriferae]MBS9335044.1 hypothetical protein [Fructobacillus papyriferae]MCD2159470.1 DnaD domain protein [Fructobacillus papyriferae]